MIYLTKNSDPISYNPAYDQDPLLTDFYNKSDADQIEEMIDLFGSEEISTSIAAHFHLELEPYEPEIDDLIYQCKFDLVISFCRDEIDDSDIAGYLSTAFENQLLKKLQDYHLSY